MKTFFLFFLSILMFSLCINPIQAGSPVPSISENTISSAQSIHEKGVSSPEMKPQKTTALNKWLMIGLVSVAATVFFLLLFALFPSGFFAWMFVLSLLSSGIFGIGGLIKMAGGNSGTATHTPTPRTEKTVNVSQNQAIAQPITSAIQDGDTIKIVEPEFSGNFLYVNQSIGNGIALEKQKCFTKANAGPSVYLTGMGTVSSKSVVNGANSAIRLPANQKLYFIVRVKDNSIDPSTQLNIFPLIKKGENRQVITGKSSTLGGVKAGDIDFQAFTAKKYGTSSYLIELPNGLKAGEYAMTLDGSRDVFNLFGVD